MNKYIVEFIGTFFLVLTIGCTVIPGAPGVIPPIAIGTVLAVMIFGGGHISGGHYNPAVTLAVTIRGKCTPQDAVPYVIFQVIGAVAAAFTAKFLYAKAAAAKAAEVASAIQVGPAFVAELLFTFALAWTVLNVATSKDTAGNSFYGWAIGSVVVVGAFSVGSISGGAFNPAVAVGAALMGLIQWGNIWIHLSADLLGGLLAALAFKSLSTADRE